MRSEFVFIVGSQKSGSTWLRNCLSHVVDIRSPEWYLPELYGAILAHVDKYGQGLSQSERAIKVSEVTRAAWIALVAPANADKSVYPSHPAAGAGSPLHSNAIRIARDIIPASKVVLIVRDPRAVFNSYRYYIGIMAPGLLESLSADSFAHEWVRNNRAWLRDKPDIVTRFEDLKKSFELTLRNVLHTLCISASDELTSRIKSREYDVANRRSEQPEIYRAGIIDEWRKSLSRTEALTIEQVAKDLMFELGYST